MLTGGARESARKRRKRERARLGWAGSEGWAGWERKTGRHGLGCGEEKEKEGRKRDVPAGLKERGEKGKYFPFLIIDPNTSIQI